VVIHTNLGRAALSEAAVEAMRQASGYCDVELDLESGDRGSRMARLAPLLADATGADAGIAVNNGAAALVLTLAALARGRQVLVSRGELVEIGGSFRLPEIMAAAGVDLVEVGTTNKTRAADYDAGDDNQNDVGDDNQNDVGDDVALLLKVHPSNFTVSGFTHAPTVRELAAVARRRGVPLVHDVGSGLLRPRPEAWLADEPSVADSLADGADLVICSGDKLLGGPQAGLLVGRGDLLAKCARHPLARALRLDKLRIAALVVTLEAHLRGDQVSLPTWQALLADPSALEARCARLAAAVPRANVVGSTALVGGGSAPAAEIPGPAVRVETGDPDGVTGRLRDGEPPVVVRVESGAVVVDLRTVDPADDEVLAARLADSLRPAAARGDSPTAALRRDIPK
jgi:L-seryl-tRNA(Ser) seleniumtransferase